MYIEIIKQPQVSVATQLCLTNDSTNPYIFKFQRKDRFGTIGVGRYNAAPYINKVLVTYTKASGEVFPATTKKIYIRSGVLDGVYDVLFIIDSSPLVAVVIDVDWTVNSTGGFINLIDYYTNYFIEVHVIHSFRGNVVAAVGYNKKLGTANYTPNTRGEISVDISPFLKKIVGLKNEFRYDVPNKLDKFAMQYFSFTVLPKSDVANGQLIEDITSHWAVVSSAMQKGSANGSNLFEFSVDASTVYLAKFLQGNYRPTFFPNYPFDLGFIYGAGIEELVIHKAEERFAFGNTTPLNTVDITLDGGEGWYVNRMMMEQGSSYAGVDNVDIWLTTDGTAYLSGYVHPDYVYPDYVD